MDSDKESPALAQFDPSTFDPYSAHEAVHIDAILSESRSAGAISIDPDSLVELWSPPEELQGIFSKLGNHLTEAATAGDVERVAEISFFGHVMRTQPEGSFLGDYSVVDVLADSDDVGVSLSTLFPTIDFDHGEQSYEGEEVWSLSRPMDAELISAAERISADAPTTDLAQLAAIVMRLLPSSELGPLLESESTEAVVVPTDAPEDSDWLTLVMKAIEAAGGVIALAAAATDATNKVRGWISARRRLPKPSAGSILELLRKNIASQLGTTVLQVIGMTRLANDTVRWEMLLVDGQRLRCLSTADGGLLEAVVA